ncbi:MAG: magnesium/cobalt transporter CorA [Planctomycetota bacterium]
MLVGAERDRAASGSTVDVGLSRTLPSGNPPRGKHPFAARLPAMEDASASAGSPRIELFGWTERGIEARRFEGLEQAAACASDYRFIWLDLEGVSAAEYAAHLERTTTVPPLALDTLIEGVRRAGADDFGDLTIVTMRSHTVGGPVEFIDLLLSPSVLTTIRERAGGDCFEPVRMRLREAAPRLVRADANVIFLLLARQICEANRPLLEDYSRSLERFERALVRRPDSTMLDRIHEHRRRLLFMRQGLAPLHEALANIQASFSLGQHASDEQRARLAALRELQDEIGALLDVVEFQKDSAQHLLDLYLNAASMRLNEILRILTIISVIFMPLTLIAGIYGMNFRDEGPWSMPELHWRYGYPFALGLMAACALSLLFFFRAKGWIGDPLRRRRSSVGPQPTAPSGDQLPNPLAAILSRRRGRGPRGGDPSSAGENRQKHWR